ncbi:MAG: VWA domain-containing protein [Spirochaetes bacterium]|nr:VWA domain-containing protein [Spirochaetota bacterium]
MKKLMLVLAFTCAAGLLAGCSENKPPVPDEPASPETAVRREYRPLWPPGLETDQVALEKDANRKNYYIIFDGSGSMSGWKIDTAKKALVQFIRMVPRDANIGLLIFDAHGVSERAPLGSQRDAVIQAVNAAVAGGWTPLGESVEFAYRKICGQGKRQLGYGEYYLVVVTDGRATDGNRLPVAIEKILAESPVVIHTIGFQIGMGHTLNQQGRTSYRTAQDFKELSEGLGEVLAESEDFTRDAYTQ